MGDAKEERIGYKVLFVLHCPVSNADVLLRRKALLDFHRKYYSANVMKLVVYGQGTLLKRESFQPYAS